MTDLISVKYRSEKSKNNYSLDVLKSALQKYIRRGDAKRACYVVREFLSFSLILNKDNGKDIKRINTNLFHRLIIIILEDVGLNALFHIEKINKLYLNFKETLEINFCIELICLLCGMYKSRECSFYKSYFVTQKFKYDNIVNSELILKYFDKESNETKKIINEIIYNFERSNNVIYFLFELYNIEKSKQKYYRSNDINRLIFFIINLIMKEQDDKIREILFEWYKEISSCQENFLPWLIYIIFKRKNHVEEYLPNYIDPNQIKEWLENNKEEIEFNDWVYDKHTKIGRQNDKTNTVEYFRNISSIVIPEDPRINEEYKTYYLNLIKKNEEKTYDEIIIIDDEINNNNICAETDYFEFKIRAQLLTSNYKTDTYFGILKKEIDEFKVGEVVFIKGPLLEQNVNRAIKYNEIKSKINLPYIRIKKIFLRCNMFKAEEIILGQRKQIKEGWFLVCEDIRNMEIENIPFEIKNSKLYKDIKVVDGTKLKIKQISSEYIKDEVGINYILMLLFRYILSIPDIANRNFLVKNKDVFSLDEDHPLGTPEFNMSKEIKEKIKIILDDNILENNIFDTIIKWYDIMREYDCTINYIKNKEDMKKILF